MAGIGVWGVYYPIVIIEEPQGYYCVVIVKEPHGRTEVVIEASMFRLSSLGNAPNGAIPDAPGSGSASPAQVPKVALPDAGLGTGTRTPEKNHLKG